MLYKINDIALELRIVRRGLSYIAQYRSGGPWITLTDLGASLNPVYPKRFWFKKNTRGYLLTFLERYYG